MDGPLQSSRDRSNTSGGGYYGGGGGGGGSDRRHGYGGGGRRRGGRGGRGGGGGGGNRRHHPYRRDGGGGHRRGGGGGPPRQGNRFTSGQTSTKSVDPQRAMLRQLSAMVAKMGDWVGSAEASAAFVGGDEEKDEVQRWMRPVVRAIGRNVSDLVNVLCSAQNAPLFLKYEKPSSEEDGGKEGGGMDDGDDALAKSKEEGAAEQTTNPIKAGDEAGPLAALVVSCASTLPLQAASYAALTLGVHNASPKPDYAGFASRCVTLAVRRIGWDLDVALLGRKGDDDGGAGEGTRGGSSADDFDAASVAAVDAYLRAKLLLRYLAYLGKIGVVLPYDERADDIHGDGGASTTLGLSLAGLLRALTDAAVRATESGGGKGRSAASLLASLVLAAVPYAASFLPSDFLTRLIDDVEQSVLGGGGGSNRSTYRPSVGMRALLLRGEQLEESVGGSDEDDDEEEEDEEDEGEDDGGDGQGGGACADTLQDALRTARKLVEGAGGLSDAGSDTTTRFALPSDAPWLGLLNPPKEDTPLEPAEMEKLAAASEDEEGKPMRYKDKPLRIDLGENCRSVSRLLGGADGNDDDGSVKLARPVVEGVAVFGRLPIFDPPPDPDADDNEEDEEEEDGGAGGGAPANPHLDAYVKTFSLADRYFLGEAVRDCLLCHRPSVTDAGAERGGARDAAEQVWAVGHLFLPSPVTLPEGGGENMTTHDPSKDGRGGGEQGVSQGVEYGIVESILSLVAQCPAAESGEASPLDHLYLSRVLVELAKLKPDSVPRALVAAVAALFEDFVPSLVPSARQNLSGWLAYHLTNTDYQWPVGYWSHWTPYVVEGTAFPSNGENMEEGNEMAQRKRNSRGEFVVRALRKAVEYAPSVNTVVSECLPVGSALSGFLLGGIPAGSSAGGGVGGESGSAFQDGLASVERDLQTRIWDANDDPDSVREYVVGDEISESVGAGMDADDGGGKNLDKIWWRTGLAVRSLLRPASREAARTKRALERARRKTPEDADAMDVGADEDPLSDNENVLSDVWDALERYRPVVLATLARDAQAHEENLDLRGEAKGDEGKLLSEGEIYVLRQVEMIASYSGVLLEGYVEGLVRHRVVGGLAVLRWVLGERGSDEGKAVTLSVVPDWWNFASMTIRVALAAALSDTHTGASGFGADNDIGMIIDGVGEDTTDETPAARQLKAAEDAVNPIIQYATRRVCHLLNEIHENGRKKILPLEVDLMEGMKHVAFVAQSLFLSSLQSSNTPISAPDSVGNETDIETLLSKSDVGFGNLASLCRTGGGGVVLIDLLARSLDDR